MEIRTIIEFNIQSIRDTKEAIETAKTIEGKVALLPTSNLLGSECVLALVYAGYEYTKYLDYNTPFFVKKIKK